MITERETIFAIVDNDYIAKSDAIILLEGDGLNRFQKAVDLFVEGMANFIVFSGGIVDYEYGSYPFSDILPLIVQQNIPESAIIHEDKSLNTKEQAIEVVKMAIHNKWKKMILVASPEHQYRAYVTFLREVLDSKSDIILYNAPARNLKWFVELDWGTRFERLQAEILRIEKYSELGHLATAKEVIEYQRWKESFL